jgi:tripartite-type tricarboxylate transporter receptor subunit TctC
VENGFTKTLGDFDVPQHLVVPVGVSDAKFTEWRDALYPASKSSSVSDKYAPDFCKPLDVSDSNVTAWYYKQNTHWSKIASGVKLDSK